ALLAGAACSRTPAGDAPRPHPRAGQTADQLQSEVEKTLLETDERELGRKLRSMGEEGRKLVPGFVDLMGSADPHTRARAAHALAMIGRPASEALPALVERLSQDVDV